MKGISGEFHRLEPVCWVKLTSHRQIVKVSSFRNPFAFVCDCNDEGYPFGSCQIYGSSGILIGGVVTSHVVTRPLLPDLP